MPRVIVIPKIEEAIATSSTSQQQCISAPQPSKDIASPVPPPVKPQPIVPKKLTQTELDAV